MRPTLRSRAPSTPTGVSTILRCASSYKGSDSQPDPGRRPWIRSLRPSRHPMQRRAGLIVAFMALLAGSAGAAALANDSGGLDVSPAPAHVQTGTGVFAVRAGTPLSIPREPGAARAARYFSELLARTRGVQLRLVSNPVPELASRMISFELTAAPQAA